MDTSEKLPGANTFLPLTTEASGEAGRLKEFYLNLRVPPHSGTKETGIKKQT